MTAYSDMSDNKRLLQYIAMICNTDIMASPEIVISKLMFNPTTLRLLGNVLYDSLATYFGRIDSIGAITAVNMPMATSISMVSSDFTNELPYFFVEQSVTGVCYGNVVLVTSIISALSPLRTAIDTLKDYGCNVTGVLGVLGMCDCDFGNLPVYAVYSLDELRSAVN